MTGDNTHASAVFKAKALPRDNTRQTPDWFVPMPQQGSKSGYWFCHQGPSSQWLCCLIRLLQKTCNMNARFISFLESPRLRTSAESMMLRNGPDTTLANTIYETDRHTCALTKAASQEPLGGCEILDAAAKRYGQFAWHASSCSCWASYSTPSHTPYAQAEGR